MKKNYYVVLDTETCNGIMVNNKLDLSCSLVYDIGWAIVDKKGEVYEKRSFIIKDIFYDEKSLMKTAYYAKKIPMYLKEIKEKKRQVEKYFYVKKALKQDCKKYYIKAIIAHNAAFDVNAVNTTQRWLTKSRYRFFLPYGIEIWDTLIMAQDTIGQERGYKHFCERHGYMTKHKIPRPRLTAEILYKYITGDYDFIESHTGLEDVLIEKEIFAACMKKHKKMRKRLY